MNELTDRDRSTLEFAELRWAYAGAKEQAIRDRFDESATRFYQRLNTLIDNPAAEAFKPLLVRRLRRLRSARQRVRSESRRVGW